MSLPGKLCVGILEEDNPLRSYFRFKPLLIDDNGRYIPYEDSGNYPQEGCIRIVPDKNESYHFKARMRQIGLFCVVDLRQHPGENDKIRPNKNFRPDGEEINASIIYSDVVRAPAEDMIFEVLPGEAALGALPRPHTPAALLRETSGISPLRHGWEALPDAQDEGRLVAADKTCPLEDMQVFDLPGFRDETVSFAIFPSAAMNHVSDMPERPAQAPVQPAPAEAAPASAPPPRQEAPKPRYDPVEPKPSAGDHAEPADAKPWIHRDDSMLPPPISPHLSRSERLLAAQAGLNPRRNRSLQELIDEKWQRSRLNQLGQPVQPIATGAPVSSPVDIAVSAVREVWRQPQLRDALVESLGALGEFRQSLEARREVSRQAAIARELDVLEAQKLQLMGELDHLKAGTADVRQNLKREIRLEEAQALDDAIRKTEAARAEQARCERLAEDARAAARDAQALVDQLSGEKLEQKIREVALTQRVLERLEHLKAGAPEADVPLVARRIDLNAFIDRTLRRFGAHGWALTRQEAANLCVCLAISPVLLLTGGPGSGKTTASKLLAEALGLDVGRRAVVVPPTPQPVWKNERIAALKRFADAPAAILLEDANLLPLGDPLRGLSLELNPEWRVIATLQDAHSGHPVCAAVWDRGFAVRLSPPATLPWQPAPECPAGAETPASIAGVLETLPQADVPAALVQRLDGLRTALNDAGAAFSRRALNDAWRYTAAMHAALGEDADPDAILDLAVAQRLLPGLLSSAPIEAVLKLRPLIADMPACAALLDLPLPVML